MALQTKVFSYGSLAYQSVTNGYILELTLTEQSADPAANCSQVDYVLRLRSGGNNRFSDYGLGAQVVLDGLVVATRDRYTQPKVSLGYHSTAVLLSGTAQVTHEEDGSKKLPVEFSIDMASGSYVPGPISVTGEVMDLTSIPRASTVGAADAAIGSVCPISVNRKSGDYTHTIQWTFGALTGYIGADWQVSEVPVKLTDTAISFCLPDSFYSQIPNTRSGVCTLTVTTYQGQTQIGTPQTATFTARVDQQRCAPILTAQVEDIEPATLALTGDPHRLVKFFSTARCSVTAQGQKGATIVATTVNRTPVEGEYLDVFGAETGEFLFEAADSRGISSACTESLELIPYVRLTANPRCRRTNPVGGQVELTVTGDWFSGSFGAAENELILTCQVDGGEEQAISPVTQGDQYTAAVVLEGLDYRSAHTLTVTVRDKLDRVTKNLTLGKGVPVFDWGEGDFAFHVPVEAPAFSVAGQELATKAYVQELLQALNI